MHDERRERVPLHNVRPEVHGRALSSSGAMETAPTKTALRRLLRERFAGHRVVVVSNREPVIHRRAGDGGVAVSEPAGGLTAAMLPVLEACGGTWVAHGGGDADFEVTDAHDGVRWPPQSPSFRLRRVRIGADLMRGYYDGLSNEALWPLCHVAYEPPIFRRRDWEMYRVANSAFARAVLEEVGDGPAVVLVNDYHLALLPRMLREARPDLRIAHFWHIPWPNREVMRVFPWSEALYDGLLGNDLLGFQVQQHCDNFLDTIDRGIEALVDTEQERVTRRGRATWVRPFPIGIDARAFTADARAEPFERRFPELAAQADGRLLLLGVDRLDYTKGIPHRLKVFETLLETVPSMRGGVIFVQIGAPTRETIPRYQALDGEVRALVDAINARWSTPGWTPVHYLPAHHDRRALAVLHRRADACLVTSLHDGMNLVAKEYVAAHGGAPGVLLLSRFTGAARELPEAVLVNPYDIEGAAESLAAALSRPASARAEAMERMFARVVERDVYDWATSMFRALHEVARHDEAPRFAIG